MTAMPLPKPVEDYFAAANAHDLDALIATFAPDALVNDARREFRGIEAIGRWLSEELIAAKVTKEIREVREHYGEIVADVIVDGEFDRTGLPDPVVLTHYLTVRDDRIVQLIIVLNESVRS
ncbi:nuclear transport factor 2 family protein [Actinoallomurus rhizosphaericola]|uniref:nuclear transport factor 2 family protein n=1 Tax=Actinoallomurus rhizosphaericola TaxID=2952536 RepID=UPI002093ED3D|nr:nuclear transport factor 2 family protein [Actinoallomurus rhizosphaericola]MCO5997022.1 nuclear transport factor 2 family protein [Actinoallomurus rhizosphaericola]